MRKASRWLAGAAVSIAVLLLTTPGPAGPRGLLSPSSPASGKEAPAAEAEQVLFRALGAFRVFAVDALWVRMNDHKEAGRDGLVLSDARTLLALDPDSDGIRDFLHWHLAFNMASRAVSDDARAQWIEEGLDIEEEGLRRNPSSAVLNRGLGMTFFMITERTDVYREVCLRRYGRPPAAMAWVYLEKAWLASRGGRTLLFLLQSLENAALSEEGKGRRDSAARFYEKAAAYAREGLGPIWLAENAAACVRFYEERAAECRRREPGKRPGGIRDSGM